MKVRVCSWEEVNLGLGGFRGINEFRGGGKFEGRRGFSGMGELRGRGIFKDKMESMGWVIKV